MLIRLVSVKLPMLHVWRTCTLLSKSQIWWQMVDCRFFFGTPHVLLIYKTCWRTKARRTEERKGRGKRGKKEMVGTAAAPMDLTPPRGRRTVQLRIRIKVNKEKEEDKKQICDNRASAKTRKLISVNKTKKERSPITDISVKKRKRKCKKRGHCSSIVHYYCGCCCLVVVAAVVLAADG